MRNLFLYLTLTILFFSCTNKEEKRNQDISDLTSETDVESEKSYHDKVEKFDISKIEENLDSATLNNLYQETSNLYSFNNREAFNKYYHFVDIDKDGDLDLIYDGWSGSEPMMFEISMNIRGKFQKQFKDFIYVKNIFSSKESIIDSLIIDNPGCCAMMTESLKYYKVKVIKDLIIAKLKLEEVFHQAEEKPSKYFDEPIKFEIQNENYWLRITPKIDSTNWYTEEWIGNRFMEFHLGDKGIALAEKKDSTGRIWWYSKLKHQDTFVHGWMSSRYLNKE